MQFMVKLGVVNGNYGAIRSATSVAAKISKRDGTLGTLQSGKHADVVVVDGNPIADLDAVARVQMTFVGGKRMV
jgi:imidazolonepropionase-like amidohydrolase